MQATKRLITSEAVSRGHPDKLADRISDSILDAILEKDSQARVAVETLVTRNLCVIAGEVRGPAVDYEGIARRVIRETGYAEEPFHWKTVQVLVRVDAQASEIARAVDARDGKEEGAGDQGMMFGYATLETPARMPAPLYLAQEILKNLEVERGRLHGVLGPDAKAQVTVEYRGLIPVRVDTVLVSQMYRPGVTRKRLEELCRGAIGLALTGRYGTDQPKILINPSGAFTVGGPAADTGLTGRKIIVDTYGGAVPHGGGAFSGKDPSKVDRTGAYAARYLAKNVVEARLAERCLVQLAYAIGTPAPVAVCVDTYGTGSLPDEELCKLLPLAMSLTPRSIRDHLGLDRPIYAVAAAFRHIGGHSDEPGIFPWERTDLVEKLNALAGAGSPDSAEAAPASRSPSALLAKVVSGATALESESSKVCETLLDEIHTAYLAEESGATNVPRFKRATWTGLASALAQLPSVNRGTEAGSLSGLVEAARSFLRKGGPRWLPGRLEWVFRRDGNPGEAVRATAALERAFSMAES